MRKAIEKVLEYWSTAGVAHLSWAWCWAGCCRETQEEGICLPCQNVVSVRAGVCARSPYLQQVGFIKFSLIGWDFNHMVIILRIQTVERSRPTGFPSLGTMEERVFDIGLYPLKTTQGQPASCGFLVYCEAAFSPLCVWELTLRGLRASFTPPGGQVHVWCINQSGSGAGVVFLYMMGTQGPCMEWRKYFGSLLYWEASESRMCGQETNPGLPFPEPDFFYLLPDFIGRDGVLYYSSKILTPCLTLPPASCDVGFGPVTRFGFMLSKAHFLAPWGRALSCDLL